MGNDCCTQRRPSGGLNPHAPAFRPSQEARNSAAMALPRKAAAGGGGMLGNDRGDVAFYAKAGGDVQVQLDKNKGNVAVIERMLAETLGRLEKVHAQLQTDLSMIKRRNAETEAVKGHGELELILKAMSGFRVQDALRNWTGSQGAQLKARIEKVCKTMRLEVDQSIRDERRGRCLRQMQVCVDVASNTNAMKR